MRKKNTLLPVRVLETKQLKPFYWLPMVWKTFDSPDKLSKFLGLNSYSHHSGSSIRRRGGITKFGSNQVRSLLYMCTRSAIRYKQPCKELYQRLRQNGKSHKLAAVAVMHKLVKQIFACVKNKTLFDNEYHLKNKEK